VVIIAMDEGCASSKRCHSNGVYVWTISDGRPWADMPVTEDALTGVLDTSSYVRAVAMTTGVDDT
jgi:hypothetical protein